MEEKTAVDLGSVPLEDLVKEVKRRMQEFESAKRELGFGDSVGVDRMRAPVARSKRTGSSTKKQAAKKRWEGWDEYLSKHPNAKPKEFFQWKKKQGK